jgi:hypothetical protein
MVEVLGAWMSWLSLQWLFTLPLVALVACSARRRGAKAAWRRILRLLLRGVPLLVPVNLIGMLLGRLSYETLPFMLLTIPVGAACVAMTLAGRLEAAGRLGLRRRIARIAGRFMLLGSLAGLVGALAAGRLWEWSSAALLAVAVCGVLGGLSGKPRPVGGIGLFFWLVAAIVRVGAGLLN